MGHPNEAPHWLFIAVMSLDNNQHPDYCCEVGGTRIFGDQPGWRVTSWVLAAPSNRRFGRGL
jgi:hypothetical protein